MDGDTATRWSSAFTDDQWLQVDLGATATLSQVVVNWETAYGKDYKIQSSSDGSTWTDLRSVTGGDGGTDTLDVSGQGRYVRLQGIHRATQWGYSAWEFQVFGTAGSGSGPIQGGGDLGPNVIVVDPSTANLRQKFDQGAGSRRWDVPRFGE